LLFTLPLFLLNAYYKCLAAIDTWHRYNNRCE